MFSIVYPSASQVNGRNVQAGRRQQGVLLIEALFYVTVLMVVLGVGYACFYRVLDHTRQLHRVSQDISRALDAGERWRADVRSATGALRLSSEADHQALVIPTASGEVFYFFNGTNVVRRTGAEAPWFPVLKSVKTSQFVREPRERVAAWRWEVELATARKPVHTRPLFSFEALAAKDQRP